MALLLKMTVNKVVQMRYNFDTSDPPECTKWHLWVSKFQKISEGGCPQTPLKVRALRALWPPPSSEWPASTNLFEKAGSHCSQLLLVVLVYSTSTCMEFHMLWATYLSVWQEPPHSDAVVYCSFNFISKFARQWQLLL